MATAQSSSVESKPLESKPAAQKSKPFSPWSAVDFVLDLLSSVPFGLILLILLSRCSSCDPRVENCSSSSSYRSSGGSYGGYSSGGSHK